MSIASELLALQTHITNAYGAVNDKGGTIPANKNMANLATAIASISGGGGNVATGVYTPSATSSTQFTITHNLGVSPKFIFFWDVDYDGNAPSVRAYQVFALIGIDSSVKTSSGLSRGQFRVSAQTTGNSDYSIIVNTHTINESPSLAYANRADLSGANETTFSVLCGRAGEVVAGKTYMWVAVA